MLARDADQLRLRTAEGERTHAPAGAARPGDIVRAEPGERPEVVFDFGGADFPGLSTETHRMPEARIAGLRARASVLATIRAYFAEQSFLEIEPPVRVPAPGMEIHIKALKADGSYLITSPEFSMKRLLAAGLERIYATCRCFRSEEEGPQHSVEFTMLEWYRAFSDLEAIIEDTEQIVSRAVAAVRGRASALVEGREIDLSPPWRRLRVAEAFRLWAGVELKGDESAGELRDKIQAAGLATGTAEAWDDLFYIAFLERIEPALRSEPGAVLLTDWPAPLAALARRKPGAPQWALRFEAYVGGIELANAFDELTDAQEQRARFVEEQEERRARNLEVYPLDEKFLAALEEGLPPCAGIALGIDRLAMLATGSRELREVSAFVGDEL